MYDRYDQFRQLERTAEGRWAEIIRALSCVDISDAINRRRHIRCHMNHGKTNAQFRVFRDFEQTGGGICNTCGAFSDGFALLGFLNGWTYKQSVKEVAQYLKVRVINAPPRPSIESPPRSWEVSEDNLQRLRELWHGTERLAGSMGETYLRNRGIECDLPDADEVRLHRRLH